MVYINSDNNYVEIYYFENDNRIKKVVRKTLTSVHVEFPQLSKTHRSYLVNLKYFRSFISINKSPYLKEINEIVISLSKTYQGKVEKDLLDTKNSM